MKSILPDGRVVVQLQSLSLPPERIIGLRVFHPITQQGSTPCWNETDEEGIPAGKPAYSEGCVKFVKYDELAQVHRGLARASFEGGDVGGHRLTYAFRDLWVLETEVPSASFEVLGPYEKQKGGVPKGVDSRKGQIVPKETVEDSRPPHPVHETLRKQAETLRAVNVSLGVSPEAYDDSVVKDRRKGQTAPKTPLAELYARADHA